ncbi:MAG: 30S ribosomal protein S2 [Chitinophagales bacterium]|nr:30S ribosomal protein S2 [Chitinophagales bacterium]MDW8273971.1 30S ribosomal protein S2 [Chitinophagales bacterium]
MQRISQEALLEAGVHFGHLKRKWNPKMLPYIFAEKKGIHIIDLNKTQEKLEEAAAALRFMAKSGKKILFVATKKQAKEIVKQAATRVNMPYVTERWLGGMLTNFSTIRKSIKKMQNIERMLNDGTLDNTTKKERLVLTREKEKMEKVLGGISSLNRIPNAIFVVDINHEHIAVKEAQRLNINTFGIVDTNSDPTKVDFAIPANDDAAQSISIITNYIADAIAEGLAERAAAKEDDSFEVETESEEKQRYEIQEDETTDEGKARGRRKGSGGGMGKSRSRSAATKK